ncbi:MAG: radical SAM protein [Anaerolineae bacterium]|nr:radical SAM protein [Anaerolineae bacterium]
MDARRRLRNGLDEAARRAAWRLDRPPVKPRQVIVDITDRCFFRCITCDKWRTHHTPPELTTDEWRDALARLHAWLGSFHLSISGGEPLLRKDLLDIIAAASARDCTTNLMSNGWLVDDAMATGLVRAGLGNLTLSLNGFRPETHDLTRGVAGSYARLMAGIEAFNRARGGRQPAPTLSLNGILSGHNAGEIPDLVRWARTAGVDAVAVQPLVDVANYQPYSQPARTFTAGWEGDNPLWGGEAGQFARVLDTLIDLRRAGYPVLNTPRQLELMKGYFDAPGAPPAGRCHVGVNNFLIDPYGGVRLCYTMDVVGDIRADAPAAIWWSAAAARVRAGIRSCRMGCWLLNCNYRGTLREQAADALRGRR